MISRIRSLSALSALALLTACGGSDDAGNGTSISIQGKTDKGANASASAAPDGQVKIDLPGFKADVNLPSISLNAEDMDIDGVKLYPGSKVTSLNVVDNEASVDDDGTVTIVFDAPAAMPEVHKWFADRMKDEKFEVSAQPAKLSGKTGEGDPFTLDFAAGAQGHTTGTLIITG